MSAWVVEKKHIQYLVGVAMGLELEYRFQGQTKTIENPIHVANLLWDANKTSVAVLDETQKGWYQELQGEDALKYNYYNSEEIDPIYEEDMAQLYKSAQCLECMSNEFNAWQDSEACAILSALKAESANQIVALTTEYGKANWGSGQVFPKNT
jgi:hypothetical protein